MERLKSLSYIIPEEISWIPNDILAAAMLITPTHLNRDAKVLRKLELLEENEIEIPQPPGKKYLRKKGWFREEAEILWFFRQTVKRRGRKVAIQTIYAVIEDYDTTRTRSHQSS